MKGIVVKTDNTASVMDFGEPLYKTVGEAVGGYIEIVRPVNLQRPFVMIINEEGKLHDLPVNKFGSLLYGSYDHGDFIVGDIVIMQEGIVCGEPDIVAIPDKMIEPVMGTTNAYLTLIKAAE